MRNAMNNWVNARSCRQCDAENVPLIMSMFNENMICMGCKDAEKKRPDYKDAEAKDLNAYAERLRGLGMEAQAENVERIVNTLTKEGIEGE